MFFFLILCIYTRVGWKRFHCSNVLHNQHMNFSAQLHTHNFNQPYKTFPLQTVLYKKYIDIQYSMYCYYIQETKYLNLEMYSYREQVMKSSKQKKMKTYKTFALLANISIHVCMYIMTNKFEIKPMYRCKHRFSEGTRCIGHVFEWYGIYRSKIILCLWSSCRFLQYPNTE